MHSKQVTAHARFCACSLFIACNAPSPAAYVPVSECTPTEGWLRHPIYSQGLGADGVSIGDFNDDGWIDVASPIEQSARVTVSLNPGGRVCHEWPTVSISRLEGAEDVHVVDVDGDGRLDVLSASEEGLLAIHFGPRDPEDLLSTEAWESIAITQATYLHRWMQVSHGDIDGDGRGDVIAGGRVHPATVAWFRTPDFPRDPDAWVYHFMSDVGWTMSVVPHDVDRDGDADVVISDRSWVLDADQTRRYDLMGSRWLENMNAGQAWASHAIGRPIDGGQYKFLHVGDVDGDGLADLIDGWSRTGPVSRMYLRRTVDGITWTATDLPELDGVGEYHDVEHGDVDGDGLVDLVFSFSNAVEGRSGVVWLRNTGNGWTRGEISGSEGTKFDNVLLVDIDLDGDLDVLTSEQADLLGVIWYENPLY